MAENITRRQRREMNRLVQERHQAQIVNDHEPVQGTDGFYAGYSTAFEEKPEGLKWYQLAPKVAAGSIMGGILMIVLAILGAIEPELLDFLGAYKPLAFAALGTLTTVIAGYIKK